MTIKGNNGNIVKLSSRGAKKPDKKTVKRHEKRKNKKNKIFSKKSEKTVDKGERFVV